MEVPITKPRMPPSTVVRNRFSIFESWNGMQDRRTWKFGNIEIYQERVYTSFSKRLVQTNYQVVIPFGCRRIGFRYETKCDRVES